MTEKDLERFAEIYKETFGEEINKQEALEKAEKLLNLYRAVYLDTQESPTKS